MGSLARSAVCLILSAFFAAAGAAHFIYTSSFVAIMPPAIPAKALVVQATGAMEIGFAIALLIPKWRPWAGWGLATFLLAVLPANVYMALENMSLGGLDGPFWLWGRVFLQFPFIIVILWACRSFNAEPWRLGMRFGWNWD